MHRHNDRFLCWTALLAEVRVGAEWRDCEERCALYSGQREVSGLRAISGRSCFQESQQV